MRLLLALGFVLCSGTIITTQTTRLEPDWHSIIAEYYRPKDCRRGEGEKRECKRLLLQFAAMSLKRAIPDDSSPSGASVTTFVPPQHPEGDRVIIRFNKAWCRPIPNDARGLWVCVAPKDNPYGITWTPVITQTTETTAVNANIPNDTGKKLK